MSTYDPEKHHRRSIRLKGYDYSQPGAYFFTIVTQNHESLLEPKPVCEMIQQWWDKLPTKFPTVEADAFVVMPNHIHGIIMIVESEATGSTRETGLTHGSAPTEMDQVGADPGAGPEQGGGRTHGSAPTEIDQVGADPRVRPVASAPTLGTVVQWFKTMTTNAYIRGVKQLGWTPFPGKLWQRNYYEHVVRSERALTAIRQYIVDNPARWELDRYNPEASGPDPQAAELWRMLQE